MICALDICRAASRVRPTEASSPLISMATDIAHDTRVRPRTLSTMFSTLAECSNDVTEDTHELGKYAETILGLFG